MKIQVAAIRGHVDGVQLGLDNLIANFERQLGIVKSAVIVMEEELSVLKNMRLDSMDDGPPDTDPPVWIDDLLPLSQADKASARTAVFEVLNRHVSLLKRIFLFYVSASVNKTSRRVLTLNTTQFRRFLKDTKCLNIPSTDTLFSQVNRSASMANDGSEMLFREFTEAVLRLSYEAYPENCGVIEPLHLRLERFAVLRLQPNTCHRFAMDDFRTVLYDDKQLTAVLRIHSSSLLRVFQKFCTTDGNTAGLNVADVFVILKRCAILDDQLAPVHVVNLLIRSNWGGAASWQEPRADLQLHEFTELVVRICAMRFRAVVSEDMQQLAAKLDVFLTQKFLRPLLTGDKMSSSSAAVSAKRPKSAPHRPAFPNSQRPLSATSSRSARSVGSLR